MGRLAVTSVVVASILGGCGTGAGQNGSNASPPLGSPTGLPGSLDLSYSCGSGPVFFPDEIGSAPSPSDEVAAALEQLRTTMDGSFLVADGWRVIDETPTTAYLIAPAPGEHPFHHSAFELRGDWIAVGWGDCNPRAQLEDLSPVRWEFAPDAYPADPAATQLSILVQEIECSSGRMLKPEDLTPLVDYGSERILVAIGAPPLSGDQTCQGSPPVPYVLQLDESVGDRSVVDAVVFPIVEPRPGTL